MTLLDADTLGRRGHVRSATGAREGVGPTRSGASAEAFAGSGLLAAGAGDLEAAHLRTRAGARLPLAAARWHAPATMEEIAVLDHAVGPVLDLACGPGRLVRHLVDRGVVAVGVDIATDAVEAALRRGVPAMLGDLWTSLPCEGSWETVLLFDGNIGIGAQPSALLGRCAEMLAPGGAILLEIGPVGTVTRRVEARIEWGAWRSEWFAWATVAARDLPRLAGEAGLQVCWIDRREGRCFARLEACWSATVGVAV